MSIFVRLGRAAAFCALVTGGSLAHAQPPPTTPAITPPHLTHFVEASDPRAEPSTERSTVELELSIDASGAVSDARVATTSGSAALDSAAVQAAKAFVFEPATRDGKNVAVRIRYEYVFAARKVEAPPPPPPQVEAPKPAALGGVIRDRENGKPIAGADVRVSIEGSSEPPRTVKTDANGAFRVDGLSAGQAHITVEAKDHVTQRIDEALEAGKITDITLRLDPPVDPEAFGAVARVEAPPREVTRRTLEKEELRSVAGTRGDPLRAIELLPGVSRPAVGGTLPIIRGANPYDTQVFMDGAPVPSLFHFAGLNSFVHSRVLDTVELYPSNFSTRYGRKVGGIIEARFRDPKTDGLHGIAEASFLDTSLLVETPIGENFSALVAVRRSNIDAFLNTAQKLGNLGITAAPVYWDYQAIAAWKPTDRDRIRLLSYGSSDRFGIVLPNPSEVDPLVRGNFEVSSVFHRVQLGYRHRWNSGSEQNTELTYGHSKEDGVFGSGSFNLEINTFQGRTEWIGNVAPWLRVVGGLDLLANDFGGYYRGTPATAGEGEPPSAISTQRPISVEARTWVLLPGAYLETGIRPVKQLLITPGVRADYNGLIERGAIDPRLSLRFDVTEATAIKAGVGRFSQSPDERHVVAPIGNQELRMTHALHASAGVEQKITETFSASVEGFAKRVDGVVTSTPQGVSPYFINAQEARIFGGELMLRVKPRGRFFGFLSYTLMRSERRDNFPAANGDRPDWRLFERDQPHIINASGVYRLGKGWEVGASLRYTSGTPYTPIVGSTYDSTADVYSPRVGRAMSVRNPAFSRLDLRVQKTWTFSSWSLAAYLDVQNVLNSSNPEGFGYNYDYTRRQGNNGLPILPILGVRGEL